jgi:predicted permease
VGILKAVGAHDAGVGSLFLGYGFIIGLLGTAMGMAGATDLRPMYVCVLLSAMPTALYSVLMANLFGLNRDLANTTFILTHAICFAVTIPAIGFWYAAA